MLAGITVGGNDTFNVYLPYPNTDYYFAVVAEEAGTFATGANYELTLISSDNSSLGTMEREPNDAYIGNFNPALTLGTSITGHLMELDDQDWYKLETDTDRTVTVAFDGNSFKDADGDWRITVYRTPEGTSIPDLNDPIASVAVGALSEFHVQMFAVQSPYYFVVAENLDAVGSEERWNGEAYTLKVSEYTGATVAEIEPNNSDGTATDVGSFTGSLSMSGQLLDADDVDWFSFSVAAGQTVNVDVTFNVDVLKTHWRIFLYKQDQYENGDELNEGDWYPTYASDGMKFTGNLDTAGTYYLKVLTDLADSNIEEYSSAEYTISVQEQ
jgi:hypothetical protein